mmetsp:Transcript_11705/g.26122  ORF Transcript_11705/g.26122 Transcript_11705/m.26122 type:complete len:81 (+) Transcript_11705:44-286(+)
MERPVIEPYVPAAPRSQVPGGMEPKVGLERFMENMKRSPLPVTKWGVAGGAIGALLGGPYGGAAGVLVGLALEKRQSSDD